MIIKQISFCTFLIESKNGSVVINPSQKIKSDICIYTNTKSGYLNYSDQESELTIKNSGEYEIKDIFVTGLKTPSDEEIAFTIADENITVGFVGFINDINNIPSDLFESVDVLIVGAGSGPFLSSENANNLVNRVSPSLAIYYGFQEQSSEDLKNTLDSVEISKTDITGLQISEKQIKVDKDYLDNLENTENFYLNL